MYTSTCNLEGSKGISLFFGGGGGPHIYSNRQIRDHGLLQPLSEHYLTLRDHGRLQPLSEH